VNTGRGIPQIIWENPAGIPPENRETVLVRGRERKAPLRQGGWVLLLQPVQKRKALPSLASQTQSPSEVVIYDNR